MPEPDFNPFDTIESELSPANKELARLAQLRAEEYVSANLPALDKNSDEYRIAVQDFLDVEVQELYEQAEMNYFFPRSVEPWMLDEFETLPENTPPREPRWSSEHTLLFANAKRQENYREAKENKVGYKYASEGRGRPSKKLRALLESKFADDKALATFLASKGASNPFDVQLSDELIRELDKNYLELVRLFDTINE